jgi:AcrR family transcriptional regulator
MTATSSSRGDKRRADVLETALHLFNARDTASVSTNHIAAALRISVGNLYWHFRDKASIVRALFAEHDRQLDGAWAPPQADGDAIDAAIAGLRRFFASAWEYRFFYRELAALTRADPELREMHAAARERRMRELREFQNAMRAMGILKIKNEHVLAHVDEVTWLISSFWLAHIELRDGTPTRRAVEDGALAVLGVYLPYITPAHTRALSAKLRFDAE